MLFEIVASKLDILLASEAKLDNSFSTAAFFMSGFSKPVRLDRSSNWGGLILYIRENITFKLLAPIQVPENLECFFINITLRKKEMAHRLVLQPK